MQTTVQQPEKEQSPEQLDLKQEQPFNDDLETLVIDILSIKVESQSRKDFGNLVELADSIKAVGLLQSLLVEPCSEAPFKYFLIAGERRYRALMMLGWKKVPVMFKKNYDRYQMRLAQLVENIQRKKLEWPEEVAAHEELYRLKRKELGQGGKGSKDIGWNKTKQAGFLGISETNAQNKLELAALMKRPDIADKIRNLNETVALNKGRDILHNEKLQHKLSTGEITTSANIRLGDCLSLIKEVASESVDCIITDPPFGLQTIEDQEGQDKGVSTSYTAFLQPTDNMSMDDVKHLMAQIIPEFFRVLKPLSHFYIFHCAQLYPHLTNCLYQAGFEFDWAPVIWDKGKTTTRFQGLSFPSRYEPIIFGHKPPRKKHLSDPKITNILTVSPVHTSKKIHTFQKPPELIEKLLKLSTKPGDMILDPFAGSGVTIRVAQEMSRNALGFEISPVNFAAAQAFLMKGPEAAVGSNA